jgi:hypothetical protein
MNRMLHHGSSSATLLSVAKFFRSLTPKMTSRSRAACLSVEYPEKNVPPEGRWD